MVISNSLESPLRSGTRANPYVSRILNRKLLSKPGSSKTTYSITLDLSEPGFSFSPGDAIGIFPENSEEDINAILDLLKIPPSYKITYHKDLVDYEVKSLLRSKVNIDKITPKLCKYLEIFSAHDLIDALAQADKAIEPQTLFDYLLPLVPRLYSTASSLDYQPQSVDLLVAAFEYEVGGRIKKGVGSSFLCDLATVLETPIKLYHQPNPNFSLPDADVDIIMIGPGTGVAPYRAFLQERVLKNTEGKNWLFFGERNQSYDFYFEDFFNSLVDQGLLKLSTAFSRDQQKKHYVQHEILKHSHEIYSWIKRGAHIYICGDAKHMAKDVTEALVTILSVEGNTSEKEALTSLREMRKSKQLMQDVY